MKKLYFILTLAVVAVSACQQKPETISVNIENEQAILDSLFQQFSNAFKMQDVSTLSSFLAEDALCLGTDPSEVWTKKEITDLWNQMLADSSPEINYIGERIIKLASDGYSAVVVDQYFIPVMSPKIPWRNEYHLVKRNGNWKILVLCSSFIPKNEDIEKINKAIE